MKSMGHDIGGSSASDLTPTGFAGLLAIARGEAAGIPALPDGFIPPNLSPGYVPVSRGWEVYIVCEVSMTIAFLVVVGRLITKGLLAKGFSPDDYAIIPALAFTLGLTLNVSFAVRYGGMGKHIWDLVFDEIEDGLQIMFSHTLIYICSMFFIKLSLLLFLYRLFYSTASTRLQHLLLGFFGFHTTFFVICILTFTLQCDPPAAGYSISLRLRNGTTCKDYLYAYHILSVIHIVSDLAAVALPMALVWKMNLRGKKKLSVSALFSLGGIACICAIMRMAYFLSFTTSFDLSWVAVRLAIWGQLEATIALVATSIPGIKLLVTRYGSHRFAARNFQLDDIPVTEMQTDSGNDDRCIDAGDRKVTQVQVPVTGREVDVMEKGQMDMQRSRKASYVTHASSENELMGDCLGGVFMEDYAHVGEKGGRGRRRSSTGKMGGCDEEDGDLGSIRLGEFNPHVEYHQHQVAIAVDSSGKGRDKTTSF